MTYFDEIAALNEADQWQVDHDRLMARVDRLSDYTPARDLPDPHLRKQAERDVCGP